VPDEDDDFLDHPDSLVDDATDDDPDLFALFADALDPNTDKTVEESEREWQALREAGAL